MDYVASSAANAKLLAGSGKACSKLFTALLPSCGDLVLQVEGQPLSCWLLPLRGGLTCPELRKSV